MPCKHRQYNCLHKCLTRHRDTLLYSTTDTRTSPPTPSMETSKVIETPILKVVYTYNRKCKKVQPRYLAEYNYSNLLYSKPRAIQRDLLYIQLLQLFPWQLHIFLSDHLNRNFKTFASSLGPVVTYILVTYNVYSRYLRFFEVSI